MISAIKKHVKALAPVVISSALCLLIISKSSIASEGIVNGLKICAGVIIPSLFPFMVFSSFIVKSGIYIKIGRILGKPIGFALNLPPQSAGAVIMGFVSGYPIGISMTAELFDIGAIEREQAKRMALFCVNAGPAFIISAVGGSIYHSRSAGYILFASVVMSSLTVGIVTGIFSRIKGEKPKKKFVSSGEKNLISAFVSATEGSARAILSICIWVVTFAAIIAFIRALDISKELTALICGVLEVTSGCNMCIGVLPLSAAAAFISFSGICIMFQLLSLLNTIGLKISTFLLSRLVCAALSFAYCTALAHIFPDSVQVFSNTSNHLAQVSSVSIPAAISLILTCIVLIFDVDRRKKIC